MTRQERKSITSELQTQAIILGGWVALMWIVELVDIFVFGRKLDLYGILPRNPIGLRGILFAPFLHGGFSHLISNTIPFLVLGWFVMLQETSDFFVVTSITMLVGGLGVWLLGAPNSVHIGASVLIFGYLGFLLFRGFFERNLPSIFLSILVGFLYGGLVWGVLPSQPHVSWQGHLFGFIGGILAARLLAKRKLSS
ncbi:MAG: rhomboid family intramembrane serine protease [Moorea sp. SIOASIH]|uniref:rhomboid family intramembrane serine protease n=1 Tax=Moorena sp. SIOASIH TaxID=2607817 RepID=UPI0013B6748A|nr:rhomboid family intramembrane serine protease [Moorena sp. SIOASIH]NEO37222.1 rhomboid family intramembrane serine protease [Moorena sp. SIOASIH]NEO90226.1 rhomboid family intramembrane serine protease [Moorena sp. SIO3G5]